jgi:DNA-binding NarL/FixJ family response regulator
LLDLRMPNLDGMGALQALSQASTGTRVILLTASDDQREFIQAMKLGCSGVVQKHASPEIILKSIRKVHAGEVWLDPATTAAVMRQFSTLQGPENQASKNERHVFPLSPREREIVSLVAQGYKNKEMAQKLFISEQTIKNHVHSVFDKLGIADRLELALYAVSEGLFAGANTVRTSTHAKVSRSERIRAQREGRSTNEDITEKSA